MRLKVSFSGLFVSLICLGIGIFLLSGAWSAYTEDKRLQDYEGRAIGHITDKHFKSGSDGGGNYYIDYWFLSSRGDKIISSGITTKQQWDVLNVDDTMEIRYDMNNPDRNFQMHGGSPSLVFAFFMSLMALVFIVFGCFRFKNSFKKAAR